MITRQQEKYGWEFIFLGANMDAIGEAGKLGIRADRAVRYECDGAGTLLNYTFHKRTYKCIFKYIQLILNLYRNLIHLNL